MRFCGCKFRRTHTLNRSDIKRMASHARRPGRPSLPPEKRLVNEVPIAMRLPPAEHQRTHAYATGEGRSVANFARRVYLIGLAQYEAELKRSGTPTA